MNKWVAVFRTGKHTDTKGNSREWTEADLDKIVSKHDPAYHEAPEVIGHPESNAPAFGWVESLKRDGNTLYAKFKDRAPEFVEMIKAGRFKKRSISLYPDMRLKHVGWLGAAPPAVKGLPDAAFGESEEFETYEFADEKTPEKGTNIDNVPYLEKVKPEEKDKTPKKEKTTMPEKAFTEADVNKMIKAALKKREQEFSEVEKKEQVFAEREAKIEADEKLLEQKKTDAIKAEINSFCEKLKNEGKVIPAWESMGLQDFMESLDGEKTLEFSEGKTESRLDWFKGFLNELPKTVNFSEVATRNGNGGCNATAKLDALTDKKMKEFKDMSFNEAFTEVQIENPELTQAYMTEAE